MASAAAVFDTYELLEMIVLHLPVRDLLLCQGVAKSWRELVERSRGIRRALFLNDSFGTGASYAGLPSSLRWISDKSKFWEYPFDGPQAPKKQCRVVINPLLNGFFVDPGSWQLLHHPLIAPVSSDHPWSRIRDKQVALMDEDASWRDMYMSQPWVQDKTRRCVEFYYPGGEGGYQIGSDIRMGTVVERLRAHWFQCPNCPNQSIEEDGRDTVYNPPSWHVPCGCAMQRVDSNITGWEMLRKLEGLRDEEYNEVGERIN